MFLGLDFETSGVNPAVNVPVQLGLATQDGAVFQQLIGGWNWSDRPWTEDVYGRPYGEWSHRAAEVHGIDRDALRTAPTVELVDHFAEQWVANLGEDGKHIHAVGWNVASFDFAFLRKYLPRTDAAISYRSVDLNAVVFSIVGNDRQGYYAVKGKAKAYAAEAIGGEPEWHDAGYDALAALHALDYLRDNYITPPGMRGEQ